MTNNTDKKRLNNKNRPDDLDIIPEPVHQTKVTRLINKIVVAALIVIAISLGIFLKWFLADTTVLDVKNDPFPARVVEDPSGQTGGIVFLKINYCKNQSSDGKLRVSYVSKSREIFLPVTDEKLPKGCDDREVPVVLPLSLLRDTYKVKFHIVYNINPVKRGITADFESQPFTVGTTELPQP